MLASQKKSTSKVNFLIYVCNKTFFSQSKRESNVGSFHKDGPKQMATGQTSFWSVCHDTPVTTAEQHQNPGVDREVTAHRPQILLRNEVPAFAIICWVKIPSKTWHLNHRTQPIGFGHTYKHAQSLNLTTIFPILFQSPMCLQPAYEDSIGIQTFASLILPALFFTVLAISPFNNGRWYLSDTPPRFMATPPSTACAQNGFVHF